MEFLKRSLKGLGLLVAMLLLGWVLTPTQGMLGADLSSPLLADCFAPAVIESEATLSPPCMRYPLVGHEDGEKLARTRCLAAPEYRLLI